MIPGAVKLGKNRTWYFKTAEIRKQNEAALVPSDKGGSSVRHVYDPQSMWYLKSALERESTSVHAAFSWMYSGVERAHDYKQQLSRFKDVILSLIDGGSVDLQRNYVAIVVSNPDEWHGSRSEAKETKKIRLVVSMCEEFFQLGLLDAKQFKLDGFEFGNITSEVEATFPSSLTLAPRKHATYERRRSLLRGLPSLLSPSVLQDENSDLRHVMIVEVLLRAPMPADPLSPQSTGAVEYGKSLRALVYRGFKGTSITMPFQMGIHKKGELTNGDLVDFMIELDLRTNSNYSKVRPD